MSNPYFDFPISTSRFVPRSLARAEDVNARFDEVSNGFDGVKTDIDLKAPLASPTFTGTVTYNTTAVNVTSGTVTFPSPGGVSENTSKAATTAWVQSVIGATSVGLPVQSTHAGKFLATNGTSASWRYLTMRTVALTSNTTLDTSHSAAFISVTTSPTLTFSAPATLGDDWYAVISNAGTGNVTVQHTSGNVDGLTSYLMYPGELRLFRCNGTTVASSVLAGFRLSFTSSSTFTMPPGYRYLGYDLIGGGAGGQCGGRTSGAGNFATGGIAGAGGGRYRSHLTPPSVGTSVTVNVGTGGTGAAGRTTTGGAVDGNSGTDTSLAWAAVTRIVVTGGDATSIKKGGAVADPAFYIASNANATGGQATTNGYSSEYGGAGQGAGGSRQFSTNGGGGGSSVFGGPAGGGGGGVSDSGSTAGGAGGKRNSYTAGGGGAAGTTGGGNGGTAADSGGGGGGGSHVSNGGNGGNGTGYGAGGGGGGAAHGYNSGAGGNGADGYAEVWGIA